MGESKLLAKFLRREKAPEPYATRPKGNLFGLSGLWRIGNRLQPKQKKRRKPSLEKDHPSFVDGSDSLVPIVETKQTRTEPIADEFSRTKQDSAHDELFGELYPGGTLGINVLYDPPKPSRAVADIVLIHGLKGHSYTTWLDTRTGTYWPVHLLKNDVPNARIMTFGYDADPAGVLVSGQSDIRDHAHTLLGDLTHERRADPHRKLIFVVHSLGGLVIKKALCISGSSAETHLNDADRSTIGIAFLGTPHRGSDLAPFAKRIADILKLVSIKTNSNILEPLKRNSQVLADIEDSFSNWLRKKGNRIDLTCFYEELGLPVTGLVVTKDSSQISGYPQISIHANHRDMGKFSGPDDAGYRRVVGEIQRWLDKLDITPDLTQLDKECLQSLAFPEMNDRGIDIDPPADGTCSWILSQKTYLSWLSQSQGLLWVKGKPGVGKSTLVKYILQSLQQDKYIPSCKAATLSFFFHGRGSELQRSPLGLYRSLLHQLLVKFPASLISIVQTFQSRREMQGEPGDKWNWRPGELQAFLEACLPKILEEIGIRIIVDALDECGEKEAAALVKFFQRLRSKCSSSRNGLNICFSCRHFPVISLEDGYEICVEDENHQDINHYIRTELEDLVAQDEELVVLENEIINRSSYVFQWVTLVLDRAVAQYNEGCSILSILERLRDTPTELHALYNDILMRLRSSHDGGAQCLQFMQWICFSTRPLSLAELRFAMISDCSFYFTSQEQFKGSPQFVTDDTKMEKRVKALSGGLAEIKLHGAGERVIQFIHQSVYDYLTGEGLLTLDLLCNQISVAIGNAHSRLARSCIRYFAISEVYQWFADSGYYWNNPNDANSYIDLRNNFPFLRYSLESWGQHARSADEKNIPQGDLLYYWHWPSTELFQVYTNACKAVGVWDPLRTSSSMSNLLHTASAYGIISLVRTILESSPNLAEVINLGDADSRKPIFYAAGQGNVDVVKLLLSTGYADPDPKDVKNTTPLAIAALSGHESVVRLLVENDKVDLNSRDCYNDTPLLLAAEAGHETVVKFLIQCEGIDIFAEDDHELSAISRAAKAGHENVFRMLLEQNPVDFKAHDRMALIGAAKGGHDGIVKLLLGDPNVDINAGKEIGTTALLEASMKGNESTVAMLIKHPNIDVSCKDKYGLTPLWHAADGGFDGIVSLLLAHREVDVLFKDEDGTTPLIAAACHGHEKVVKLLLGCSGIDSNAKNNHGLSILTLAAAHSWMGVVRQLLDRDDIDINSRDHSGRTALSWAAEEGSKRVVELLESRGAT